MKLQHLSIIFIIIILPISLVIGEYIQSQIDTIYLQTQYSKRLQDATYDAMKAFQLNTVNNKYSSLSDSKIRDIEASISTFYNSLGTSMGASGYDQDTLKEYIPAIVYTMYDGYYIYGKYFNYNINQYQYGLKPYIYYSCRYVNGTDYDFIINYTLDNSITIYGKVDGQYYAKSGYVINPDLVKNIVKDNYGYVKSVEYDGITIEREILQEQLITIDDKGNASKAQYYQYTKYNNQKIYKDGDSYFTYTNNSKQYLTDEGKVLQKGEVTALMYGQRMTEGGILYNNSAAEYYAKAYEFSKWLSDNLKNIDQNDAKDADGKTSMEFSTDIGNKEIFVFSSENNPLVEGSTFDEHRKAVIRKSIETNLLTAIANYNVGSAGTYEFQMPVFTEEDWDKLLNNISISTFMQGVPIKSKYFNNYCVITNNKNEEVVTQESIYILAKNKKGIVEAHLPTCVELIDEEYEILGAYNLIDYERQTIVISDGNEVSYYPQAYQKCYSCIVNVSINYEINDIIQGKLRKYNPSKDAYETITNIDISDLRKIYLKALARERYDLYRSNINI